MRCGPPTMTGNMTDPVSHHRFGSAGPGKSNACSPSRAATFLEVCAAEHHILAMNTTSAREGLGGAEAGAGSAPVDTAQGRSMEGFAMTRLSL